MVGSYSLRKLSVTKRIVRADFPTPPPPSTTCKAGREQTQRERKEKRGERRESQDGHSKRGTAACASEELVEIRAAVAAAASERLSATQRRASQDS